MRLCQKLFWHGGNMMFLRRVWGYVTRGLGDQVINPLGKVRKRQGKKHGMIFVTW